MMCSHNEIDLTPSNSGSGGGIPTPINEVLWFARSGSVFNSTEILMLGNTRLHDGRAMNIKKVEVFCQNGNATSVGIRIYKQSGGAVMYTATVSTPANENYVELPVATEQIELNSSPMLRILLVTSGTPYVSSFKVRMEVEYV